MHAIGTHLSVLTKVLLVSKLGAACMGTAGAEYTQETLTRKARESGDSRILSWCIDNIFVIGYH